MNLENNNQYPINNQLIISAVAFTNLEKRWSLWSPSFASHCILSNVCDVCAPRLPASLPGPSRSRFWSAPGRTAQAMETLNVENVDLCFNHFSRKHEVVVSIKLQEQSETTNTYKSLDFSCHFEGFVHEDCKTLTHQSCKNKTSYPQTFFQHRLRGSHLATIFNRTYAVSWALIQLRLPKGHPEQVPNRFLQHTLLKVVSPKLVVGAPQQAVEATRFHVHDKKRAHQSKEDRDLSEESVLPVRIHTL